MEPIPMNQRLIVYTEHRSFDAFGQVFATAYTPNINLDLDSLPGTDRKYSSFGSSFTHLITVSRTTSKLEFSGLLSHEVIRPDRSLLRTLNGLKAFARATNRQTQAAIIISVGPFSLNFIKNLTYEYHIHSY